MIGRGDGVFDTYYGVVVGNAATDSEINGKA